MLSIDIISAPERCHTQCDKTPDRSVYICAERIMDAWVRDMMPLAVGWKGVVQSASKHRQIPMQTRQGM